MIAWCQNVQRRDVDGEKAKANGFETKVTLVFYVDSDGEARLKHLLCDTSGLTGTERIGEVLRG